MRRALGYGLIFALTIATLSVYSVGKKKKEEVPLDPKFAAIGNISVLSIVDARAGKKTGVDLKKLQENVVHELARKHYEAHSADTQGDAIAIEDVDDHPSPAFAKKLGAATDRWVMLVFLDDVNRPGMNLHSILLPGGPSSTNAELSGYLFDKDTGTLLWKQKGLGRMKGQTKLLGFDKKQALDLAVGAMLASVPERPKP